jgi:presenilin-like A22 family membrane protease
MKFRYYFAGNYLLVQVLALIVGVNLWTRGVVPVEHIEERAGSATPFVLVGLVLIATLMLLILIKYGASHLFYYFIEYGLLSLLIFFIVYFSLPDLPLPLLGPLSPDLYISLLFSGIALYLRYTVTQFSKVSVIVFAGGAAAILGALEIYFVIVLLVVLSVYDVLAVRKAKHMGKIADDVYEKGSSLLFVHDTEKEIITIGSADIVLPSTLVVSVFLHYSSMEALSEMEALLFPFLGPLLCSILAFAGILIATRKEEAPALPYASLGILGFLATELLRFF